MSKAIQNYALDLNEQFFLRFKYKKKTSITVMYNKTGQDITKGVARDFLKG